VVVDASEIPRRRFIPPMGFPCFIQVYEVVYTYGQIELKAYLRWTEGVCDESCLSMLCGHSDYFCKQDEEKRYPSLF